VFFYYRTASTRTGKILGGTLQLTASTRRIRDVGDRILPRMQNETETLTAADGTRLVVYMWAEPGAWTAVRHGSRQPHGVVQVVHGMAEHARRYARFASALAEQGWAVIAHDQRGHGQTATAPADLGHFADDGGWRKAAEDVDLVGRHARETWPGCRYLVRFGHSMGSTLVLQTLGDFPGTVDGAILTGPVGVVGRMLPLAKGPPQLERWRQGKRGKSTLCDRLVFGPYNSAFEPSRTSCDWLSKDVGEVDAYVNDPRCGFLVTNQFWLDLFEGLEKAYSIANIAHIPKELPIRFLSGGRDPVSKHKFTGASQLPTALSRMRASHMSCVTERVWLEGRHELLNDVEREDVTADILAWLESNFPKNPQAVSV